MLNIPLIKLNNGQQIPQVGLGTFLIKDENLLIDIIVNSYEIGYRLIDTAQGYENEQTIGKALKQLFNKGVKRENLFIVTKYYPFQNTNAKEKLQVSLQQLGLEYVDMYLLHCSWVPVKRNESGDFLSFQHQPVHNVWPVFEDCLKSGLTKNTGVSNFQAQSLIDLLSYCQILPAVNQIEIHPYLTQQGLRDLCQTLGIAVIAYSPLGSINIIQNNQVLQARGGLEVKIPPGKKALGQIVDIFNEPVLQQISKKYQKSVAQVVLRYLIQLGLIIIPKTEKVSRLQENISLFDFNLNTEEIASIDDLNCGLRTINTRNMESYGNISAFE